MAANAYTRASGDLSVLIGNWRSRVPQGCMTVAPRPFALTRVNNESAPITTVDTGFLPIVSYIPDDGYMFMLGKIVVTWTGGEEQLIRVTVDGEVVAMYHASTYVMDWFGPGVILDGDGAKKVEIDAKAIGAPAELVGFINGDVSEYDST